MKNQLPKFLVMGLIMAAQLASSQPVQKSTLIGAWQAGTDEVMTKIYSEQNFSVGVYNLKSKQFISTEGGRWTIKGADIVETIEFSSADKERVGKEFSFAVQHKNGKLVTTSSDKQTEWSKIDSGTPGKLAGAWLITGRMTDGQLNPMTPGARRTMKILSGTRFQWIAYNTDTKEFFGTGGGTYTTENGKYTENIEFFSRDNNRVGASLQFDFSLESGAWHHKGLSSKGEPIHEVWTKREKVGL
jgi:hypothetical protein